MPALASSVNEWFPDVWIFCNIDPATLPDGRSTGLTAVANPSVIARVGLANPCMGSFVGRNATATHDTNNNVVAFRQTAG